MASQRPAKALPGESRTAGSTPAPSARPEPFDAPLFKTNPSRGFREDWELSCNMEGTVPTKQMHYWTMHSCEGFRGACTVHTACGEFLHFDADHRLINDQERYELCSGCSDWAIRRLAAGYDLERGKL